MITLNQRVHHLTKQVQKKKNQMAVADLFKTKQKKNIIFIFLNKKIIYNVWDV